MCIVSRINLRLPTTLPQLTLPELSAQKEYNCRTIPPLHFELIELELLN